MEYSQITGDFVVSKSASRSSAIVLDATAVAGNVYIYTAQTTGIKQVAFYLDDVKRSAAPYRTDTAAPFDLAGGSSSSASPLDTAKLPDGIHTLTARIQFTSGGEKIATATFLVDNGGKLRNSLLVSQVPNRSGAKLLEGSSLSGQAYIFAVPSGSVKQISFYLDDLRRARAPFKTERYPFYDFAASGPSGESNAFDTAALARGQHIITAAILTGSGQLQVVNASFMVGSSSPAPQPDPTPTPAPDTDYALRGNPGFSTSQLTAEQLKWYEAIWKVINNPDQHPNAASMARSDDIYKYRGDLQGYVLSLLTAFRLTGDLKLLDEVSEIAEAMRGKLADGWRGTKDGTDGTRDGFLNWVNRYDTNTKFHGKDMQRDYELKAHAMVAIMAWALQNNRDLRSPAGYNYGSQADFWKDYLVNHFEAKWRERNGKPSGFPFSVQGGFHTNHSFMRYHYYMGKLTGNSAYTREAERMTGSFWGSRFRTTDSKYGTALVWSNNNSDSWLHPQTYARYVVEEAVDLHFEGFGKYADDATLERMANAVSAFMIDNNSFSSFARDIGGGASRAGIPASPTTWDRMSQARFAESPWSFLAAWDTNSGSRTESAALNVYGTVEMVKYGRLPKRIYIPTAMFLEEMLGN